MGELARPPIGEPSPPIDLPTSDGGRWRSTEHTGRAVVIVFHRHIH